MLVKHEEALSDPLVHDDECDLWVRSRLVVELIDGLLELWDLFRKAEVALSITQTISIDDEVSWVFSGVLLSKDLDGILDRIFHLSLDDLLSFLLDDELRVVLTHLDICGSCKANDRIWSRMADINSNEHGALCLQDVRELHYVEVAAHLAVHLLYDIGGLRQIERLAISAGHYLGGHF